MDEQTTSLATELHRLLQARLQADKGWLPFDRFMALALYAPGAGYYNVRTRPIGRMPSGGSDFQRTLCLRLPLHVAEVRMPMAELGRVALEPR